VAAGVSPPGPGQGFHRSLTTKADAAGRDACRHRPPFTKEKRALSKEPGYARDTQNAMVAKGRGNCSAEQ
jgi:hypothetical protein